MDAGSPRPFGVSIYMSSASFPCKIETPYGMHAVCRMSPSLAIEAPCIGVICRLLLPPPLKHTDELGLDFLCDEFRHPLCFVGIVDLVLKVCLKDLLHELCRYRWTEPILVNRL